MPKCDFYKLDWPKNLIADIFSSEEEADKIIGNRSDYDVITSVMIGVTSLSNSIQHDVLMRYYHDKKSLNGVGQELGKSPERIRQIKAKALRLLRHPSRVNLLRNNIHDILEVDLATANQRIADLTTHYEGEIDRLKEVIKNNGTEIPPREPVQAMEELYYMDIEKLDLSVRAYNCLARANIKNVSQIISAFQEDKIYAIRNMGRRSVEEVYLKLTSLGIPADALNVSDELIALKHKEREMLDEARRIDNEARRIELAEKRRLDEERKEAKHKADAEEQAARIAKYHEAIKYLPEIRDKIIADGVDGLELLFRPPVLDLLRQHVEKFQLNERCIAIMMMTEITDPESKDSPIKEMIDREGLEKFNGNAFKRLRGYNRYVSWERYQYRGVDEDTPTVTNDKKLDGIHKLYNIYVRSLPLSGEVKAALYAAGMVTAHDLYRHFNDVLPARLNEVLKDEYFIDLLSNANIYDVNGIMSEVRKLLVGLDVPVGGGEVEANV